MSDPQLGLWMLGLLAAAVVLGFPIAFSLLALGLAFGALAMGADVFPLIAHRVFTAVTAETVAAVPLFLFGAGLLQRSSLLRRLHEALSARGGDPAAAPASSVLWACGLLGAAGGTAGATVAVMARTAWPAMLRAGYSRPLSAGVICAAAGLGLMAPPSVLFVLYGASSGVPVSRLFAGALAPAALLVALYAAYVGFNRPARPAGGRARRRGPSARGARRTAAAVVPVAALALLALGPYLAGAVALWEGAGLVALASLALCACEGSLGWTGLKRALFGAARTTAALVWLLAGSAVFAAVFGFLGGQIALNNLVLALEPSPAVFLVLAQLFIFALGWPLEWPEIVIVVVPFLLPLLDALGIDPLFFGVLLALNIQTSLLSPPVATAPALLARAVKPRMPLDQIYLGAMPFLWLILLEMAILYLWPGLAMWLPDLIAR